MRKLTGLMLMVLFAAALAACGDDGDDEGDATEEATEAVVVTEVDEAVTEAAGAIADDDAGTPVGVVDDVDSPIAGGTPIMAATPGAVTVSDATTGTDAVASPAAEVVATPEAGSPEAASGGAAGSDAEVLTLSGEVTLPGTAGETFVVTEDGCVGLNGFSDMRAGRQLVVRDAGGTIVGVTSLEATDATDSCAWSFSVEVPESEFYAVSVPMVTEHVFTSDEVEADGGEITVPLR